MSKMLSGAMLPCLIVLALVVPACSRSGEQVAAKSAPVAGATCAAHGAPTSLCFVCDAGLREKGRLWCDEHDRYEDRCFLCHPDLRDPKRPYCEKHHLYEDECFLCRPELIKKSAASSKSLMCKEHGVPEDECGICHPDLLAQKRPGEAMKVRLPSPDSAAKAGIVVAASGVASGRGSVECLAEISFNQRRLAVVTPGASGIVTSIEVDLGSRVAKGALMARIASAGMGEAESAYLTALADEDLHGKALERQRRLRAEGIVSDKDVDEAEAAWKSAHAKTAQSRQRLGVLGLSEGQVVSLASDQGAPGELEVRAPFAGEVVERTIVQGTSVDEGASLFTVADTASMWAMVDLPESQLRDVRVGQRVQVTVPSLPDRVWNGTLTWLPAAVDERTRMARGRVEIRNDDGSLKSRMYGRAVIFTTERSEAVVVPRSAVETIGETTLVFVPSEPGLFEARSVRLGTMRAGEVEVIDGLRAQEPIVVAGAFALKSQLLISRLGAGCAD